MSYLQVAVLMVLSFGLLQTAWAGLCENHCWANFEDCTFETTSASCQTDYGTCLGDCKKVNGKRMFNPKERVPFRE